MSANELPKNRPSKHFLFELIFNEVSLNKIYDLTGRSEPYIRKMLREYNLPTPREYSKTILREVWKVNCAVLYMRLNALSSIATNTSLSGRIIPEILHDLGIPTDLYLGSHVMRPRLKSGWRSLSPHLQQVLEGEMLSDGYLALSDRNTSVTKHPPNNAVIVNALDNLQWFSWLDVETEPEKLKKEISLFNKTREILAYLRGANYRLKMASSAAQWVDYVATQFREGGYYVNVSPGKWIDKDGVEHPMVHLQTESSFNLYKERLRWYDLVKGVPWNFSLTPISFLHWFMGDGSFNNEITISTNYFHLSEVISLALQLRRKVGVKARLIWRPPHPDSFSRENKAIKTDPHDPNRYWVITMPVDRFSRKQFLDYLGMAPGFQVAKRVFPWKFSKYTHKEDCV
ncbi:MAG: hypothetical protein ACFFC7_18605 [Candidatus Hermodarchaeota archaeon]